MPETPITPVGKLTPVTPSGGESSPVGKLTPVEPSPSFQNFNPSDFLPKQPKDIEPIIEELARTSRGGLMDSEKDVLRDLLTNPNLTGEQAKRGIAAIQGYDNKQSDDNTMYYLKQEDNGVIVPQALAYGERPPQGYDVAKVWGNKEQASDDSWYTDLGKSLYNGVIGAAQGAIDLAQLGTMAVTDEESAYLNNLRNTAGSLKFEKDEDLNKPIFNAEGIKEWSDLLDKNRFDVSPEALWGTINMATESIVSFMGGAKAATTLAKAGPKTAAFIGSYMSQLGSNIDAAKEAGLEGRDVSAVASVQTAAMAAIDAMFGLESKIYSNTFKKAEKELLKDLGKSVERDAAGMITELGFKELAKNTTIEYAKLARIGAAEIGKDVLKEGTQEAGQEFLRQSAEQLWDKLSPDDKAKFGTDITSPEAFAKYIENGISGLVGGAPMAVVANQAKKKYDEQSINALGVVQKGPEAIKELKSNLAVAKDKGTLSENEYNQAIFKVDAYDKYNEQTKDLDLSEQEKKEAFELSFNIEALKSEIPTSKEDIDKLDPIAIAKIDSKKELIKGLQKQLNEIILKEDAAKETKVGQETVNKVNKTMEPTEGQTTIDALRKKIQKLKPEAAEEVDIEDALEETKPARRKIEEVPVNEWNDQNKTTSLQRKQIVQEALKTLPNNEIEAKLQEGQNQTMIVVMPDGRKLNLAQSVKSTDPKADTYIKRENFPKTKEEGVVDDAGRPMVSYKEPVAIKRVEVDAFDVDEDGNEVEAYDKDGNRKRKAVLSVYNKQTGKHIAFVRELDPYKGKYVSSKYSPTEKAELNKITNANHLTDEISPYTYQPKQEKGTGQPSTKKKANVEKVGPSRQDTYTAPTEGDGTVDELSPREKAVLAAKKPELKLITVPKQSLKGKKVDITITNSAGEELTTTRDALKEQIAIEKELGLLEMLNKCIHG